MNQADLKGLSCALPLTRCPDAVRAADANLLALSWHDSARIPHLSAGNVLDYFCDRCNPFYTKTCNNEILRMQNRDMEQLR